MHNSPWRKMIRVSFNDSIIRSRLSRPETPPRKVYSIALNEGNVARLDAVARALPRPIPMGTASSAAVRSLKYTTLEMLLTAGDFRELCVREDG